MASTKTRLRARSGRRLSARAAAQAKRHLRVRKNVTGSRQRPRLVVNRSARHMFAQIVDDTAGRTLASASSLDADFLSGDGDKTAKARQVGERWRGGRARQASAPWCSTVAATPITAGWRPLPMPPGKAGWISDGRNYSKLASNPPWPGEGGGGGGGGGRRISGRSMREVQAATAEGSAGSLNNVSFLKRHCEAVTPEMRMN